MEHFRSNVHKILQIPWIYSLAQNLLGRPKVFEGFCHQMIKPHSGDTLFDLGCGTGTLLRYISVDVKYTGLDINERYIKKARSEFEGREDFLCCNIDDAREMLPDRYFDLVIAIGVLHHLSDSQSESILSVAKDLLSEQGKIITLDPVLLPDQNPVARFLIKRDRGCWVRTPEKYQALAGDFPQIKTTIFNDLLNVPYDHFVMELANNIVDFGSGIGVGQDRTDA